jgi:CheY-like chemotaxis protein
MSRSTLAPTSIPVLLPSVLLVDDSPLVLRALTRVLGADYRLTTAGCGQEALELVQAGARFDAIVCDVAMPRLTGVGFYRALQRDFPEQAARFLFATGGAETMRSRSFLLETRARVLLKPFGATALRTTIESVRRSPR